MSQDNVEIVRRANQLSLGGRLDAIEQVAARYWRQLTRLPDEGGNRESEKEALCRNL